MFLILHTNLNIDLINVLDVVLMIMFDCLAIEQLIQVDPENDQYLAIEQVLQDQHDCINVYQ